MKKKILFACGMALAATLMAGCDKIEKDQYWLYAGANGTWYDTDEDVPMVQNAFIEKYTGVRCKNCPTADEVLHTALEKYGDRLSVAAIHSGAFAQPYGNDEDLRCDAGNAWYEYFGISTQPAALVMRAKSGTAWDLFTPTANFDDKIDAVLNADATVGILTTTVKDDNGNYCADIAVAFARDVQEELTLTVLLMEDGLYTTQITPTGDKVDNYEQNHVLRTTVTDPWGIDINAKGTAGEKRTVRLSIALDDHWNENNCTVVAFVSEKNTRKILNVSRTPLK